MVAQDRDFPNINFKKLENLAILIARQCGQLIENYQRVYFENRTKNFVKLKTSITDPVTIADNQSEILARKIIHKYAPHDAILGEESGLEFGDSKLTWIIDPIDGTVNYLYGIENYAVSIAVASAEKVLAGAVFQVKTGDMYSASLGLGAKLTNAAGETVSLSLSQPKTLAQALIGTGFSYSSTRRLEQAKFLTKILPQVRDIRRMGSAALDICMVSRGALDAYYEHGLAPWDYAAATLIASEIGAKVTRPSLNSLAAAGQLVKVVSPTISDEFDRLFKREKIPNEIF